MENIKKEMDALKESTAISRLVAETAEKQDRNNKRLMLLCLVQSVIIVVLICSLLFVAVNGQKALDDAMWKALNAAGEVTVTTETTTQSAEGDNVTFNNVDGEQYNDSAQKVGAE